MWRWSFALVVGACAVAPSPAAPGTATKTGGAHAAGAAEDLARAELALERMNPAVAAAAAQTGLGRGTGADWPVLARLHAALGDSLWNLGRREQAEQEWRSALEVARRSHQPDPRAMARALIGLSEAEYARGNLRAAVQLGQESLAACERDPSAPPLLAFRTLKHLGLVSLQAGHVEDAIATLRRADGLLAPGDLWTDLRLISYQATLAEAYRHARNLEASVPHFATAVSLAARHRDRDPLQELDLRERLAKTLELLKRQHEAAVVLEAALDLAERRADLAERRLALASAFGVLLVAAKDHPRFQALQARYPATFRSYSPTENRITIDPAPHEEPPLLVEHVASEETGNLTNAARTVAGMRGELRECYASELARNNTAHGSIRLRLEIGAGGQVTAVRSISLGPLGSTAECAMRAAARAHFARPSGGSAVVVIPVTFAPTR